MSGDYLISDKTVFLKLLNQIIWHYPITATQFLVSNEITSKRWQHLISFYDILCRAFLGQWQDAPLSFACIPDFLNLLQGHHTVLVFLTQVLPPYLSIQLHNITYPPSFYLLLPSCFTFQCGYLKELYPFQFLTQHPVQSDSAGAQHITPTLQHQCVQHSLNVKHKIIST